MPDHVVPGSFRDPSGFLFFQNHELYRQINKGYQQNYDHLIDSNLYEALVESNLLIPHKEADIKYAVSDDAYKIIKPEYIPFISYPYEWSFSQLKDAALTTLDIQKKALKFDMSLKDCSAYNIQFACGKPVFIDTLSFEKYTEGQPWVAYKQFCQHFLAPLALMAHTNIQLSQVSRVFIDGIPLDLASSMLGFKTRFKFSLLSHVHLHAKSQRRFSDKAIKKTNHRLGRMAFLGLIDNLESAIRKLKPRAIRTEWVDYYEKDGYEQKAFEHKKSLLSGFLDTCNPESLWDLGANTGVFSRLASDRAIKTIAFDIDPGAVENSYLQTIANDEENILPLVLDLRNPSPGIGWQHEERMSLVERGPADMVFALALIHHLAISNNLPFDKIAQFFAAICNNLAIEFVPKQDEQVKRLLATREDIFPNYTREAFEKSFEQYFEIMESNKIESSERVLYLMVRKT